MKFNEFITACQQPDFFGRHVVFAFVGTSYPASFFSLLFRVIRSSDTSFHFINLEDASKVHVRGNFETSFLGSSSRYWLGDLSSLSSSACQEWHDYAFAYKGPNTLIFFTTNHIKIVPKEWQVIMLPEVCDGSVFHSLFELIEKSGSSERDFLRELTLRYPTLAFDVTCMMMHYASLVGQGSGEFFSSWADELVITQESLFALSQSFFAKNGTKFFKQWARFSTHFSPQFWVAYWSEQLWRAHSFIPLDDKGSSEARFIAARLPFSFTKYDWRNYTKNELKAAHHYVYGMDYALKNNSSVEVLDLFFSFFFKDYFVHRP